METREQAEKLLKKVKKFILCAIDNDGYPTAKAVLPSKGKKSLDKIYFVTNTNSKYVKNIMENDKTSVYFFNPILFSGCLVKGKMTVCDDVSIKEKLWKSSYKSAYPNPKQTFRDPDFCVLEFSATKGRYYRMFKTTDFEIHK